MTASADWLLALLTYVSANATLKGAALLWLAQMVGYLLMIPTSMLSVAAGCAFGLPYGLVVGQLGHFFGCFPPFMASRRLIRRHVAAFASTRPLAQGIMAAVDDSPATIVMLLRLSPAPLPLSYLLGLTSIPATTYLWATQIGAFPYLFMSVYLGTLLSNMSDVLKGDSPMPWPFLCMGTAAGVAASAIISGAAKRKIDEAARAALMPSAATPKVPSEATPKPRPRSRPSRSPLPQSPASGEAPTRGGALGKWQHYGRGRWSDFSVQSTRWLEQARARLDDSHACAGHEADLVEELRGQSKHGKEKDASLRRIRLIPATGSGSGTPGSSCRFFLVTAPLLQRLKEGRC
jgi:uncharacterized membrane protein YdjX (TVP38/TMEM64 family)